MSLFRLCYMLARYPVAFLALARRHRHRRVPLPPLSMRCACGDTAIVWLAHPGWGQREFCGDCFTRRKRRRERAGRVVLVAIGVGALVALVVGGRR